MTDVIDPEKLTKDQLLQALSEHGVQDIPAKKARKQVFVDLYLKHIRSETETTEQNENFSDSTEDDEIEIRDLSQKPQPNRRRPNRIMPPVRKAEAPAEVQLMSNSELAQQLRSRGVDVGPIIASTRKVYERKLGELLLGGPPQHYSSASEDEEEDMEEEPYEEEVIERDEPEIVPKSSSGYQSTLIRPRLRDTQVEQETTSYTSRSYQTSSSTAQQPSKAAPKKGMSLIAKLLIVIILAVLVYLVVVNMEGTRPKPKALSDDPEAGKTQT